MDISQGMHIIAGIAVVLLLTGPAAAQQITAPCTITAPGTYTLGSTCRGSGVKDCIITIKAPDVTLDGQGYALFEGGIYTEKAGTEHLNGITIKNIWIEGGRTGLLLSETTGARVSGVTIVETVSNGLYAGDSGNIRIEDSVFLENVDMILDPMYENAYHGAIVLDGTETVTIRGCTFLDQNNAIVLLNASGTTISSNYFHNNADVVYHKAEGTTIANNYLSSVHLAYDTTSSALNTTLHDGTNIVGGNRMGGNFWYRDDGSGYSQTCVDNNHSGICDSPYVITNPPALDKSLRTDFFPLCGPIAPGKPVRATVTPMAVHTTPAGEVYRHGSPTPWGWGEEGPTTTKAMIPAEVVLAGLVIGALAVCFRK